MFIALHIYITQFIIIVSSEYRYPKNSSLVQSYISNHFNSDRNLFICVKQIVS